MPCQDIYQKNNLERRKRDYPLARVQYVIKAVTQEYMMVQLSTSHFSNNCSLSKLYELIIEIYSLYI